jgi:hypothetical protein
LRGVAYGACANQFRLLAPHAAGAREYPRGASSIVVTRSTHDGSIPVTGNRDRTALIGVADGVCADQFRTLLHELRLCHRQLQAPHQRDNRQSTKNSIPKLDHGFSSHLGL